MIIEPLRPSAVRHVAAIALVATLYVGLSLAAHAVLGGRPSLTIAAPSAIEAAGDALSAPAAPDTQLAPAIPHAPAGTWTRHACADCIVDIDAGPDSIWAGTASGGIVRWSADSGSYERWTRAEGLPGEYAFAIAAAPDGEVWAMTGHLSPLARGPEALAHFRPGAGWAQVPLPDWFGSAHQRGMDADAETVWIATSGGLALFAAGAWSRVGTSDGALPSDDVHDVAIAPDGTVWAGTAGGVARLDAAGAWSHIPWPAGTPAYAARVLHVTADGRLWVAVGEPLDYVGAGLMEFDGTTWRHYRAVDGLRHDSVSGIASTPDGRVWFAHSSSTVDGLSVWDGAGWTGASMADGLPAKLIWRLGAGPDGALWAGSIDGGLVRLSDGAWTLMRTDVGPFKLITFDVEFHGETLWFAHFNIDLDGRRYISRRDGSGWRDYAPEDGLPEANTLTDPQADAAIEPSGAYWRGIRSPDEGPEGWSLVRFDGSASTFFGTADGLPDSHVSDVSDLASMQDGSVWATYDRGLFIWGGSGWSAADVTGLPSRSLTAVAAADLPFMTPGGASLVDGWIGGADFVARGSGRPGDTWTVHRAGTDTSLPTGAVVDIDSRQLGGTWIVTENGAVAHLDGRGDRGRARESRLGVRLGPAPRSRQAGEPVQLAAGMLEPAQSGVSLSPAVQRVEVERRLSVGSGCLRDWSASQP